MLFIAAGVLAITLFCIHDLTRQTEGGNSEQQKQNASQSKVGGSAWSGFSTLIQDPYLLAIAVFIVLYTFI